MKNELNEFELKKGVNGLCRKLPIVSIPYCYSC